MRVPSLDAVNPAVPLAPVAPAASDLLVEAVRALAGHCDGAITRDMQGFNGTDTKFGNRLAQLPEAMWTAPMRDEAYRMLAKYQTQLARYGIDYAQIPAPAKVDDWQAQEARQDARRALRAAGEIQATLTNTAIVLRFPYQAAAVDAVKALPWTDRKWDAIDKVWRLTPSAAVATEVLAMAGRFGWNVADEVATLAASRVAPPPTAPDAPPAPTRTIQLELGTLAIRWPYGDPDFRAMHGAVKAIPGRSWDGEARVWRAPVTAAASAAVAQLAERYGFDIGEKAQAAIAGAAGAAIERAEASRALDAEFDVETLALPLRPFQRAGVAYATRERRVFIADEMGLGKTPQGLATVESVDAYPALFVVPTSLRRNWEREARKFLPHRSVLVVTGTKPYPDYSADIVVVGYDVLHAHVEELETEGFQAMVLDESHYAKNPKAGRTKAVLRLGAMPGLEVKLCLSGTPLPNKPVELLPQLAFLDRLNDLGGRRDFWYRYCNDWVSAEALAQLHEQLRQTCFVRRTKVDVMPELPAVQVSMIDADLEGRARKDIQTAQETLGEALEAYETSEDAEARTAARGAAIGALSTIRRLVGLSKVPSTVEWIHQYRANGGGKLIVFAHHVEVQEQIAAAFPGCAAIRADMSDAVLYENVDRFQTDPECWLIVVSLMKGSVGFTLTAASHMLVVELPWVPKDLHQAHGRAYGRINDAHGLNAYHMVAPGTLDDRVAEILERKLRVTTAVQDGQILEAEEASKSILGELLDSLLTDRKGHA